MNKILSLPVIGGLARRSALRGAAKRAFGWLDDQRDSFRVGADHGPLPEQEAGMPWRVKPLGELIFLLLIMTRHACHPKRLDGLTRHALAECAQFDWHALAAYDPSAASPMATVLEFFAMHAVEPPLEREYLKRLNEIGYFDGMDRVAYRSMDVIYGLWRIGYPERMPELRSYFAETPFGRAQIIPRYSIDDMYSLTHALFYLTDVGFRVPESIIGPEETGRLRQDLVALTAVMIRADNCDVLGELLLCWMFCGFVPQGIEVPIFEAGWQRVLAQQGANGAVPSTARSRERNARGEATFTELYHTTLVAAMLFSLAEEFA